MITITRDIENTRANLTWNYCTHDKTPTGKSHLDDIVALVYCGNGHLGGLSKNVHTVSNGDGVLHPSYVCTMPGCTFHEWVRLDGWNWNWYDNQCAPGRP